MQVNVDDPWMTLVSPLGKIYLHATRISRHAQAPEQEFAVLSVAEQARAERLQGDIRANYIITRIWLRSLLGAALNTSPAAVQLENDALGKPVLACRSLHFNWSHSRDACVLAMSRTACVGVDIEFHKAVYPHGVAERFYHPDERALLVGQDPEMALHTFYRLWSRKEAHYKCVGGSFMGGSLGLDTQAHRVGNVWLWDFQGPFPDEPHALGLAAMDGGANSN